MLPLAAKLVVGRRIAAAAPAAGTAVRCASEWLQGRPPAVDPNAGTLASFYYKAIREAGIPTKDFVVASQQNEKQNVGTFDMHVYAYAKGLLDGLGVKKGTKIALWMTNELENAVMQYACALAGATVLSLDPALSMSAVQKVLQEEGARILWFSPRFGGQVRSEQVKEAFAAELEDFEHEFGYHLISSKRFRQLKYLVTTGMEAHEGIVRMRDTPVYGLAGQYDYDEIAAVQHYLDKQHAMTVYYTAGANTDTPVKVRAAPFTHAEAVAAAANAAKTMGLGSADVLTVTAPLSAASGFVSGAMAAAAVGAKTVYPSRLFDAPKTLAAMTLQQSTALVATAEQVEALNAELAADAAGKKEYNLSSLKTGLVVGAKSAKLAGAELKAAPALA